MGMAKFAGNAGDEWITEAQPEGTRYIALLEVPNYFAPGKTVQTAIFQFTANAKQIRGYTLDERGQVKENNWDSPLAALKHLRGLAGFKATYQVPIEEVDALLSDENLLAEEREKEAEILGLDDELSIMLERLVSISEWRKHEKVQGDRERISLVNTLTDIAGTCSVMAQNISSNMLERAEA